MGKRRTFGTVRELPSGRWQARYELPGRGTIKAPVTYESRKAAELWLDGENVARAAGTWVDRREGLVSLADYAKAWAEGRALRPSTTVRDVGYVDRYIRRGSLAELQLGQVDAPAIRAWVAELRGRGLAPATVRLAGQTLQAILGQAVADRRLATNQAELVRWPTSDPLDLRVLTPAEIDRLVAKMDHRYRLLVKLGCYAGLRIGEIIGLQAGDVDPLRRLVRITRTTTEVSGHLHTGPPKTKAGRRSVPIPSWLAEELAAHLVGMLPDDLVWEAPGDSPIRLASWRARYWLPAIKAAELDGFRIHDMRHTAVTLWIAAGVDPRKVAAWGGHSSVVYIFDRYGHLMPGDDDAAMARLTALRDASLAAAPAGELVELRP